LSRSEDEGEMDRSREEIDINYADIDLNEKKVI